MRKLIAFVLILMVSPLPAFATFGAATAWDVRTTGVDTNGGAFDSGVGSPGTDESQGSGTAITVTLTTTTAGTGSPAFTATTHGPGNFVHIASGTGCTVGWYEILSQSSGTATFDHAMGTAANVCVGTIGGSLLTIGQANTNFVASNTMWIQSGTYTQTASITWAVSSGSWIGYQTTHGDNGTRPLITTATNSTTLINTASSNNGVQIFNNLSLSNTATTRASGIWQLSAHGTAQTWTFVNCLLDGFTTAIDNSDGTPFDVAFIHLANTEIKNTTSGNAINTGSGIFKYLDVFGSYIHNNGAILDSSASGPGLISFKYTIIAANAQTFGLNVSTPNFICDHCTFANNINSSGTLVLSNTLGFISITNSLFYGNTSGTGLAGGANVSGIAAAAAGHSNAFGNNATNFTGWNGSPGDVILTANPFTASGSGDYSLNSTAGGGAALKAKGFPGIFPGATSTGSADIGAVQSAGGGGTTIINNFGQSN